MGISRFLLGAIFGFQMAESFNFGHTGGIGLIERKALCSQTRQRTVMLAAGIQTDTITINVNPKLSRASGFWKQLGRRVTKETQFARVLIVKVVIASPDQYLGWRLVYRHAGKQPGMNVNGLRILVIKRKRFEEGQMLARNFDVAQVVDVRRFEPIGT